MESILLKLEWLSKYGIIDIIFGVGIFSFLYNKLKRRTKKNVTGIELMPEFIIYNNKWHFQLIVKNLTPKPLYLYKAYLTPGYFREIVDNSTMSSRVKTFFFMDWYTGDFPKVLGMPKNTEGLYLLPAFDMKNIEVPSLLIEPSKLGYYRLQIEYSDKIDYNKIIEGKKLGILSIHYVLDVESGVIKVNI